MKERADEYLRRNLLHASAVGAHAGARVALERLHRTKRPAKWLMGMLQGVAERAGKVAPEMARHRDEMKPQETPDA